MLQQRDICLADWVKAFEVSIYSLLFIWCVKFTFVFYEFELFFCCCYNLFSWFFFLNQELIILKWLRFHILSMKPINMLKMLRQSTNLFENFFFFLVKKKSPWKFNNQLINPFHTINGRQAENNCKSPYIKNLARG